MLRRVFFFQSNKHKSNFWTETHLDKGLDVFQGAAGKHLKDGAFKLHRLVSLEIPEPNGFHLNQRIKEWREKHQWLKQWMKWLTRFVSHLVEPEVIMLLSLRSLNQWATTRNYIKTLVRRRNFSNTGNFISKMEQNFAHVDKNEQTVAHWCVIIPGSELSRMCTFKKSDKYSRQRRSSQTISPLCKTTTKINTYRINKIKELQAETMKRSYSISMTHNTWWEATWVSE